MSASTLRATNFGLTGAPTPAWTADEVRRIGVGAYNQAPVLTQADVRPILADYDVWDMWPLALPDGGTAHVEGGRLWFALTAAVGADPDTRHDVARIRLLHEVEGVWRDAGDAMPDGFTPGSREWSGSSILRSDGCVTLFFTASGRRGDAQRNFEQRMFQTSGRLAVQDGLPRVADWQAPHESVVADDDIYLRVGRDVGVPGAIKALRDPSYFRDPADGADYLLFAASLKRSSSPYNGMVGIARATDPGLNSWTLEPPLLHADTVNNELERPHAIVRDGLYYIFWCTQGHVFAPEVQAPTGLYGVIGEHLRGPYRPLNGTGLVFANPALEPKQAYAWWVTGEGEVTSFVDHWGLQGRRVADHPELARAQFGGTPAPFLRLAFHGDRVDLT